MSHEPDLASAIADVQAALERLRIAANRSAASSQGWDFVDSPPEASGGSRNRVSSPQLAPRVTPSAAAAPTRAQTAASFPVCPQYCLDLCARLSASSLERGLSGPGLPGFGQRRFWTEGGERPSLPLL